MISRHLSRSVASCDATAMSSLVHSFKSWNQAVAGLSLLRLPPIFPCINLFSIPFSRTMWPLLHTSAGSILDMSKYCDTCERSISILDGIAILRYIEYRMIRRYLGDISYDPEYRPIRYLNNRRYGSIARKSRYRDTYY